MSFPGDPDTQKGYQACAIPGHSTWPTSWQLKDGHFTQTWWLKGPLKGIVLQFCDRDASFTFQRAFEVLHDPYVGHKYGPLAGPEAYISVEFDAGSDWPSRETCGEVPPSEREANDLIKSMLVPAVILIQKQFRLWKFRKDLVWNPYTEIGRLNLQIKANAAIAYEASLNWIPLYSS